MADTKFRLRGRPVYVAGHRGMVGSALVRRLASEECQILTADREDVDLRDQAAVRRWFDENRPEVVLMAAARVGGIYANDRFPGDFLYDNLAIATSVIESARCSQCRSSSSLAPPASIPGWHLSRVCRHHRDKIATVLQAIGKTVDTKPSWPQTRSATVFDNPA